MIIQKKIDKKIEQIIKQGGVGVLPTDTIYGLVGSALSKKAVKRIYQLRRRHPKKPMIILISSLADLKLFNIKTNKILKQYLDKFWPGKISIVLSCPYKKFKYLHRSTKTLAFRLPAKKELVNLIKKTGPIVAPSANLEGQPPAVNIKAAQKYFANKIDFYVNNGRKKGSPSTLIAIKNNQLVILRKGKQNRLLCNLIKENLKFS